MKMGKRFENGRSIKVIKRFSLFCSNQLLNSNMEIRLLHLKDIGVFKDEVVFFLRKEESNLAEIHTLTGQNGTGKTTILQALASGMLGTYQFDF
jgi:predicted AAA+ superfamily ATPase